MSVRADASHTVKEGVVEDRPRPVVRAAVGGPARGAPERSVLGVQREQIGSIACSKRHGYSVQRHQPVGQADRSTVDSQPSADTRNRPHARCGPLSPGRPGRDRPRVGLARREQRYRRRHLAGRRIDRPPCWPSGCHARNCHHRPTFRSDAAHERRHATLLLLALRPGGQFRHPSRFELTSQRPGKVARIGHHSIIVLLSGRA